jgi:hypothetical protein
MAAKSGDRLRVRADKILADRTEGNDFAGSVLPPLGRAGASSLEWSEADSTLEYVLRHRMDEYRSNIEEGELNSAASNLREAVVILLKIMDMAGLKKKKEAVVEAKTSSFKISRKLISEFMAALNDALDDVGIDPVEELVQRYKIDGTFPPRVPQILAFEIRDRAGAELTENERVDLQAARRAPLYPYRRKAVTPSEPAPDAGEDLTPNSAPTGATSGDYNED